MSRIVSLLTVALLLLVLGNSVAGAAPRSEWLIGRPATADLNLNLAQYSDSGRCFNTCVAGRIFNRCQVTSEGDKENCCSLACNRFNNWADD